MATSATRRVKALFVLGTRPEAIKLAPLILGMQSLPDRFQPVVCATGQHREMLAQALAAFAIRPDHDLAIMTPGQELSELTARALQGASSVIRCEHPDVVVVQGDTTTTLAGGLASFYARVPVAHVEAGLRTGDLAGPFPEELNRTLVDRLSTYCFAPTERERETLLAEGIPEERIHVTGNTGIDAFHLMSQRLGGEPPRVAGSESQRIVDILDRTKGAIVLITLHRREIFGEPLAGLLSAIRELACEQPSWTFVYPVHMNPNVSGPAEAILAGLHNVLLLPPQPYEAFVYLMRRATAIVTDSGGIQEEVLSIGTPVVAVRERTERRAGIESGVVVLAGTSVDSVRHAVQQAVGKPVAPPASNPYGDGRAADRILAILSSRLREP